jgi:EpsI family protein
MKSSKFWVIVCLLVAATTVLRVRGDVDKVPPSEPLNELPLTIGSLTATDIPLDAETLEVLGKGSFLNRVYAPPAAGSAAAGEGATPGEQPVSLFIGYFPTQRTGQAIHSPQHCLPGAGWIFEKSGVTDIETPGEPTIKVGEYVISNGTQKQEVLYWYRSHGRSIASDYAAKLYTLVDSIRYSRTDAALIRIITPIVPGENPLAAHQRAVAFAEEVNPMLPPFIPN